MKLGVTLDILNQKDTPAFYADTLANRPAAGFTGRVFISTDTLDLYRDTGTTWVLLSPSSTGTITGSGAAGQVTFFSAASSITGSNNLFWDNTNGHLGIKTITPDCALDVNHDGAFVAKFNNTTSANTLLGIYNADNPQWLIGSNNVADDLIFYDATNSPTLVPTTTIKIDGTTFIGGQNTGSGRLNVYSATGDNGIQISGANAPSLRIDNAPTGATKRIGLGISTATNNFIQGSADRDMCIFNGSTTASPMLFGIYGTTNVQEAARISAARNFLIGTTTDSGYKLNVNGTGYINNLLVIDGTSTSQYINFYNSGADRAHIYWNESINTLSLGSYIAGGSIKFETANNVTALTIDSAQSALFSGKVNIVKNISDYNFTITNTNATGYGMYLQAGGTNNAIDVFNASGSTQLFSLSGTGAGTFSANVRTNGSFRADAGVLQLFAAGVFRGGLYNFASAIGSGTDYSTTLTSETNTYFLIGASITRAMSLMSTGNLLIGTTTDAGQKLQVNGTGTFTEGTSLEQLSLIYSGATKTTFRCDSAGGLLVNATAGSYIINYIGGTERLRIKTNTINISSIPTSPAGLSAGDIYSNLGVLTIV